jgi:mannobiose 2-epimerase
MSHVSSDSAVTTSPLARPANGAALTDSETRLGREAERELRENILPFWLKYSPDPAGGGFQGEVRDDLTTVADAPRGQLLTCRILWTFSAAYRHFHDERSLAMARRAYDDLNARFWDQENGGLYWTIDAAGKPLNQTKQIYGQVFGIYALSEYYRATGDASALERAIALYRLLEERARDGANGGYFEVFSADWRRDPALKSVVNGVSSKSQNTHLHVMEAYTALLRVWPDAGLRRAQHELLEIMLGKIYDGKTHHLSLYLTDDWLPRSRHVSYGHDIEAAWLMTEAAEVLGDPELIACAKKTAVEIADVTRAEGVDVDGGLFNEGGPQGLVDSSKDWWPQAEAVVGFLDAYQISGDRRYWDAAEASWMFIEKHLVDRERGEWFHSMSRDGQVRRFPKISLWKCPYHNSRACFEVMDRVAALKAAAAR